LAKADEAAEAALAAAKDAGRRALDQERVARAQAVAEAARSAEEALATATAEYAARISGVQRDLRVSRKRCSELEEAVSLLRLEKEAASPDSSRAQAASALAELAQRLHAMEERQNIADGALLSREARLRASAEEQLQQAREAHMADRKRQATILRDFRTELDRLLSENEVLLNAMGLKSS
jgi:hypothetical protein